MKKGVLFVCLGNICRSPMAEAIFSHLIVQQHLEAHFFCDSAGTSAYHIGEPPDDRALAMLQSKGLRTTHRARQFIAADAQRFSYIFTMDKSNYEDVEAMTGFRPTALALVRDYDPKGKGEDVPDPYYGGKEGFEEVYNMLLRSLQHFLQQHKQPHK